MSTEIVIQGWKLTEWAPEVVTVRDLELAERLGLSQPRDIRRTILKQVADGTIKCAPLSAHSEIPNSNHGVGYAFMANERATNGKWVTHYHLDELAAIHLTMVVETKVAVDVRKEIAAVYQAWRRGTLVPVEPPQLEARLSRIETILGTLVPNRALPGRALDLASSPDALEEVRYAVRLLGAVYTRTKRLSVQGGYGKAAQQVRDEFHAYKVEEIPLDRKDEVLKWAHERAAKESIRDYEEEKRKAETKRLLATEGRARN